LAVEQEIGEVRFGTSIRLATAFRLLAILTVIGGVVAGVSGAVRISQSTDQNGAVLTAYIAGVAVTTIVSAAFLAFFGHALELLVGVYTQLWHLRFGEESDEGEDE
jgi:hypothetical protein